MPMRTISPPKQNKKGIPLEPGCLPMYLYNLSPAEDGILASRPGHGIGYTHSPARLRHVILQHRHIRRTTAGYVNRCLPSSMEIQYRNGRQATNCTRPRTTDAVVRLNRHRCISHESNLQARFVPQPWSMASYSDSLARAPARTPAYISLL